MSGCETTDGRVLSQAANTLGNVQAGVSLGDLPPECRQHIGRVVPQIGEKPRWTQKRWEYVADAADQRVDNCAAFYDRQRELLQDDHH